VVPSDRWPDPNVPKPGFEPTVFMGPISLPDAPPRKRRWGWLLVWTLLVFAGGVAAGPILTSEALTLIERVYALLGRTPPQFAEKVLPTALAPKPASVAPSVEPLPAAQPGVEDEAIAGKPPAVAVAPPAAKPAEREKPAAKAVVAAAPVARAHSKREAKTAAAKDEPAKKTTDTNDTASPSGGYRDPFTESGESAKTAASSHKSKTSSGEAAPKAAVSRSSDSLDNLMADVVTEKKGKDKQPKGKGVDALLQEVQKGQPEAGPAPKREAPASLPPLSQSDISRVMAGVKTRAKDCARQHGQTGVAELKLAVGKEGNVTDVRLGGKLTNTSVGTCIERAARAATFPRSSGLRFDFRIDVR
jgi:hypothetical protein